jgi:hypothetical protein
VAANSWENRVVTVLKVATCQFPVSADIEQNIGWITQQMHQAARHGARVAHFPEGALSGYAGADFETFTGYDWGALDRATGRVRDRAAELGMDLLPEQFRAAEHVAGVLRPFDGITIGRLERNVAPSARQRDKSRRGAT